MAFALAGTLDVDPRNDAIQGVKLDLPVGQELPSAGFESGEAGFVSPPEDGSNVTVVVDPNSDRLQLLEPFPAWDGQDFINLPILLKAKGKCTTDHISAAGPWLKYRGHLENISGNLFLGAINAFTDAAGQGRSFVDGETHSFPDIAKAASEAGLPWIAVGDENWGEGSSREHAAMEPRYRGAKAILVRSFARIHETNLKKQGVLPLTFADADVYDRVLEDDTISVLGLADIKPESSLRCTLNHADGTTEEFVANHTMSEEHIGWFRAGGALNVIRQKYLTN
jgi:aconitate hydratase